MDIIAQTLVAASQAPASVGGANASANKTAAQSVAAGDGKGTKSFTNVLDKTVKPIDKADQPDNTTLSIQALLQGLSPALLMALLNQGLAGEKGNAETDDLKLDPAAVKALQTLGEQSDALNQLIASGAFQQWLVKVSDLLSAMNAGNGKQQQAVGGDKAAPTITDQTIPKAAVQAIPKTADQAQVILTQFMTALSQNKDSLLFQQLVDSFQEVVSPVVAAQLTAPASPDIAKGLKTGNNTETSLKANASSVNMQAALKDLLGLSAAPTVTDPKDADTDMVFKLQIAQTTKPLSKLDTLSAKSGVAERMMLAALQSGIGSDSDATNDVQAPMTDTMQLQDLLRTLSTDSVKPAQPMTAQSFVQDMSQFVLKSINVNGTNGFSEAKLSLSPANLGQVDVKLTMQNGQLVAHFAAQTVLGKEMLEGQLSQLKQSLQDQGLQVARLEVTQNGSLQSSLFQDQRQQQFTQQFARQNKSKYSDGDSLPQSFSVEMANMTALRNAYSNGFDVTA